MAPNLYMLTHELKKKKERKVVVSASHSALANNTESVVRVPTGCLRGSGSMSSGAVCAEVLGSGTGSCRGCRILRLAFGIEAVHHRGVGYRSKHTDSLCSDPSSAPQMIPMSLCQSRFGPETL